MLKGAHCVLDVTVDYEGPVVSRHFDEVVGVVSDNHELGERNVAEDGVVGKTNGCHIEVDSFSAVVLACDERDGETHSSQRDRGAVGGTYE